MINVINMNEYRNFSPEYRRAIDKLINCYDRIPIQNEFTKYLLITDSIQHIQGCKSHKDIPKGKYWRWNQAKIREYISANKGEITIKIIKYTPRKSISKSSYIIPKLKIWYFEIISIHSIIPSHYVWCEKGFQNIQELQHEELVLPTNINFTMDSLEDNKINNNNNDIKLEDYSFLGEFMEDELVKQFWPTNV